MAARLVGVQQFDPATHACVHDAHAPFVRHDRGNRSHVRSRSASRTTAKLTPAREAWRPVIRMGHSLVCIPPMAASPIAMPAMSIAPIAWAEPESVPTLVGSGEFRSRYNCPAGVQQPGSFSQSASSVPLLSGHRGQIRPLRSESGHDTGEIQLDAIEFVLCFQYAGEVDLAGAVPLERGGGGGGRQRHDFGGDPWALSCDASKSARRARTSAIKSADRSAYSSSAAVRSMIAACASGFVCDPTKAARGCRRGR